MGRYIKADAVKINYIGGFKDTFEVDYDSFMNAPSIDIVRCEECKYKDEIVNYCYENDRDVNADDFCSYGEREGE